MIDINSYIQDKEIKPEIMSGNRLTNKNAKFLSNFRNNKRLGNTHNSKMLIVGNTYKKSEPSSPVSKQTFRLPEVGSGRNRVSKHT